MPPLTALPPSDAAAPTYCAINDLRALVTARTSAEGRNESLYPGLRYYRFSNPTEYRKTQVLMPGVVVVLQGSKTVKLGERALSYDESSCLVLGSAATCHGTVVRATPARPYLAIHLDLPPELLVQTFVALAQAGALAPAPAAELRENFVAPVDVAVLEALARLLPAADAALDRATIAPLVVEEIVVRLLRSNAAAAIRDAAVVTRSATRIRQSMFFIREQLQRPLSVTELADEAAMSPSHYAHSFRQVAGMSPMRYLREARLDAARALLLGGGLRPSEAAARTGFDSPAHFTREFRRRFDASPSEYLRRIAGTGTGQQL